jgi:hypothetical protein
MMKKINTKYNKYNVGDIVGHIENRSIDFEVMNVLSGEPEKKGDYWYVCKLIKDKRKPIPQGWATAEEVAEDMNNLSITLTGVKYNYKEDRLFLIKKFPCS